MEKAREVMGMEGKERKRRERDKGSGMEFGGSLRHRF